MNISAFDVIGPAMIGPSSSHTAGAVRIGLVARSLLDSPAKHAVIGLHGSFASTGKGHATDRGLVAGLLGYAPDDERLKDSLSIAESAGLAITWKTVDLGEDCHPNTAMITLEADGGESHTLVASSVGGGSICCRDVDGYPTSFEGSLDTVLIWHRDSSGFLAKVTALLACVDANIATIRTSRHGRGTEALTVFEVDAPLPADCLSLLGKIPATARVRVLPKLH